ncbi:MAG: MarR family winged helix-turn-helix transcriptional regulator [Acidimicrobiales bacterium]
MTRPRWQDDGGVLAWSALLRAHAAVVRSLERDVERSTGLSLSWYDVLLELNAAGEGRMRMQDLGEAAVLSRTRVSRIVDEMERAGLARRDADPDDGRAVLASITPAGRTALRRAAPVYLAAIHEHFADHLSPDQVSSVRDAMDTLLDRSPDELGAK